MVLFETLSDLPFFPSILEHSSVSWAHFFLEQKLNFSGSLQSWQSNKIRGYIPKIVQPHTSSESLSVYLHKINIKPLSFLVTAILGFSVVFMITYISNILM